jgi:nucleoside-diphosphate-sugar epimerase
MQRAERVLILGGTGFLGSHFVSALGKRAVAHTTKTNYLETNINFREMVFQKNQIDEIKFFLKNGMKNAKEKKRSLHKVNKRKNSPSTEKVIPLLK